MNVDVRVGFKPCLEGGYDGEEDGSDDEDSDEAVCEAGAHAFRGLNVCGVETSAGWEDTRNKTCKRKKQWKVSRDDRFESGHHLKEN